MFDKTLDAAIGKREILSHQFEELNDQLERPKAKLIEESIGQIGAAGEQERKRLTEVVDNQIALIREKVETTRESAQEMVQFKSIRPLMNDILGCLTASPGGLTQREIAARIPSASKLAISYTLKEMNDLGYIRLSPNNDKYVISSTTG